jgi:hypothetical protein
MNYVQLNFVIQSLHKMRQKSQIFLSILFINDVNSDIFERNLKA